MQKVTGSGIDKAGIAESGANKSCIMESEIISNRPIAREIYKVVLQCGEGAAGMEANAKAKPGQFINVYLHDRSMLLPRPLSVCLAEDERITLVYRVVGKGTKELSTYKKGETLKVSTPLGKGYDIGEVFRVISAAENAALDKARPDKPNRISPGASGGTGSDAEGKTIVLAAGGLGVPPMLELAKTIRALLGSGSWSNNSGRFDDDGCRPDNGCRFHDGDGYRKARLVCALGFQDEPFLTEELTNFCNEVHIATDSGTAGFHGTVLAMMEAAAIKGDYYLSCGPKPMLKALAEHCARENKPLQVSLEERMGCGYGACVGCTCRIREKAGSTEIYEGNKSAGSRETTGGKEAAETAAIIKRKKVCTDGPVFFGEEVVWDE